MTNNRYRIEALAPPLGPTVVVIDDGSGLDWLILTAEHDRASDINLAYSTSGTEGTPVQAAGFYLDVVSSEPEVTRGNRLIVTGAIENAQGSVGADTIAGNILANILYGDPTEDGPGGADSLFGGAGNDLIFGGAGADQVGGAGDDDRIFGGLGADTLDGDGGRDTLEGGAGADDLTGGSDDGDTLSYLGSAAGVRVKLTYGDTTLGRGGDAEGDRIRGFDNILGSASGDVLEDTVKGTIAFGYNANLFEGRGGNDALWLGGGNDRGYGGDGSDSLYGEAGRDRLYGGDGSDTMLGGAGPDRIWGGHGFNYMSGEGGADTITGGDQRDLVYGGDGGDTLHGEAGNDLIFANDGSDSVSGGSGDDDIAGQTGADILRGGAGQDEFLYFGLKDGGDRILDMTAEDRVEFQLPFGGPDLSWDNSGPLGANQARLVDTGPDVELRVNLDTDAAIEFRITFVGAASVAQAQIEL
ncbi:calcium-binding protein [Rubellimicrobium arenae]|uniref:calcium-binding protein n=1 Tax=Rubellimicrobium arenae TaxID=2817372 RepID=UPI001B3130C9|nr:calcium-binding protein [Rubellimicrobium arenae]